MLLHPYPVGLLDVRRALSHRIFIRNKTIRSSGRLLSSWECKYFALEWFPLIGVTVWLNNLVSDCFPVYSVLSKPKNDGRTKSTIRFFRSYLRWVWVGAFYAFKNSSWVLYHYRGLLMLRKDSVHLNCRYCWLIDFPMMVEYMEILRFTGYFPIGE